MKAGNTKDVALVLSSGGPRGFAYIGAIEELERRGYNITSVAGTSIGSLIGGIHAAGKLQEVKEWLFTLDAWKVFTLMDISISMNHIVKGDNVISALKEIVPSVNIEDLDIPYKAIATDLFTGEEIVFSEGDLFTAIRASISIPSLFRPVKYGYRTLIDGGIVNTMPIDRVDRNGHDILIAFDVNDVDVEGITKELKEEAREAEEKIAADKEMSDTTKALLESMRSDDSLSMMEKIRLAGQHGHKMLSHPMKNMNSPHDSALEGIDGSYYSILSRTFSLMNHSLAKVAAERFKPDVLVKMPFDTYGEIADYAKAREIAETGRELMSAALDRYENNL